MATPPGPASAPELGDPHPVVSSDDESSASYLDDLDVNRGPRPCRWRTTRFHDRECSRYFDCPSHSVERSLSDAGSEPDPLPGPSGDARRLDEEVNDPSDHGEDNSSDDENSISYSSQPETESVDLPNPSTGLAVVDMDADNESSRPSALETTQPAPPQIAINSREPTSISHTGQTSTPSLTVIAEADVASRPVIEQAQSSAAANELRRIWTPPSRERMNAPLPAPRRESIPDTGGPSLSLSPFYGASRRPSAEWSLPRWLPDGEVTYCPICRAQFSFFVRKHHCRKCGRVVCNACSPHRIIIPHQYIVRPPGSDVTMSQSLLADGLGGNYFDANNLSGGERVRLCNPCVPDPNIAPPQSPRSPLIQSPRTAHQRSRSSTANPYGSLPASNMHGAMFSSQRPVSYASPLSHASRVSQRSRSVTMGEEASSSSSRPLSRREQQREITRAAYERFLAEATTDDPVADAEAILAWERRLPMDERQHIDLSSYTMDELNEIARSSRMQSRPRQAERWRYAATPEPPRQIAEEDECPVCHRELPSRDLENAEQHRESHIESCIQGHSAYGTPRDGTRRPTLQRRTGMYAYKATEKDCVDDAECTICLEEFTVGVAMARLECLCRFHKACIASWFVNHPGRCPVHQHDGLGY